MPLDISYSLPVGNFQDRPKIIYDLLPVDQYQIEIIDINKKESTFDGETRDVLEFTGVILNDDYEWVGEVNGEQKARGRRLWYTVGEVPLYPPKQGGKPTALYKFVSDVVGHPLTRDECKTFVMNTLMNRQVRVNVNQRTSKMNRVYNRVESTMQIRKNLLPFSPDEMAEVQKPEDF